MTLPGPWTLYWFGSDAGLDAGNRIVSAAHFLIDAEGSLQDGLDCMPAGVDGPEDDGFDAVIRASPRR